MDGLVVKAGQRLKRGWNVVFRPERAAGKYNLRGQARRALDTRLNPGQGRLVHG